MFIQLLIAIITGMMCGIVTGLIPGIHINLIVTLLIASAATFLTYTTPIVLCTFIIALSITHQFLEFIPGIFLGAPNPGTALSVLPGHRYLLKGNGLMALKLSTIGCFFGLIVGGIFIYPLIKILPLLFEHINRYMLFCLIIISVTMTLSNRKKMWALFVFLLAGLAGVATFSIPNVREPLFPLLTGLFGTATLLISLNDKNIVPEQIISPLIKLKRGIMWKAVVSGQFSALFVSIFPGMSPAIAALFGMQLTRNIGDHGYMILQGCINASGFLLSIITFYTISKARNGAVIGIQTLIDTISLHQVLLFTAVSLISAALAVPVTLYTGRLFCKLLNKINYKMMIITIMTFITILVFIMSGWIGLVILATTTAIGIVPAIVKVTRTQAMGCLLIPVMLYYVV
jgi:putative membrane protein